MTETQELQQLEEKLKELTSQLDTLKSKRVEYSQRLDKAEQECRKAEDYHHVMNLMSAHMHCCLNQEYRRELDEFWSSRDDIAYANGDIAYIGRKAVYAHYAVKAEKRAVTAGRDDGKTPGYRQFNLIGTPYVEIAGDGQTAIGIWMSHSYNASAEDGDVSCQGVLGRYSGEFIKENGVWKIWRRRCYVDLVADEGFMVMPNGEPVGPDGKPTSGDKPKQPMAVNPKPTVESDLDMVNNSYTPTAVPTGVPELPTPHDTWTEEQSYIKFKKEAAK